MQYDYVPKTLKKYIIKIPSINLSYSKELKTLSCKMVCFGIKTCTAKQLQQITWNSEKGLDFLKMSYRCTYIITCKLPGDSGPDSPHVVRLDDNN